MKKTIYMQIEPNETELPVVIADSVNELAEKLKVSPHAISKELYRYNSGKISNCRYRKVTIDLDEDEKDDM